MGPNFAPYAQDFWKPLEIGLQRSNESELFSACLEALGEITGAIPSILTSYFGNLMEYFYQLLNVQNIYFLSLFLI